MSRPCHVWLDHVKTIFVKTMHVIPKWKILIPFVPKWSSLIKSDPFWSSLIRFDQVWSSLIKFDQVWSTLIQFDPHDPKEHDYSKIFIIVQKNNNKSNNKVTLRTLEVNSRGQKRYLFCVKTSWKTRCIFKKVWK
jgi:hypothetical protein